MCRTAVATLVLLASVFAAWAGAAGFSCDGSSRIAGSPTALHCFSLAEARTDSRRFRAASAGTRPHREGRRNASFDYYLLALSWEPGFCNENAGHDGECKQDRDVGFMVHGLWPQSTGGGGPEYCSRSYRLPSGLVRSLLDIMPTEHVINHEWSAHGTCSGLVPRSYFATVRQAFQAIKIPGEFQHRSDSGQVSRNAVETAFANANHAQANDFRVVCRNGELTEVRVCLTKDLRLRPCAELPDCPDGQIRMAANESR